MTGVVLALLLAADPLPCQDPSPLVRFEGEAVEHVTGHLYRFDIERVLAGAVPADGAVDVGAAEVSVGERYEVAGHLRTGPGGAERLVVGRCGSVGALPSATFATDPSSDEDGEGDGGGDFNVMALAFITFGGGLVLYAAARTKQRAARQR